MEINTVREVVTVLSFLGFAGIVVYALSPRNKQHFDEAARLPHDEDGK